MIINHISLIEFRKYIVPLKYNLNIGYDIYSIDTYFVFHRMNSLHHNRYTLYDKNIRTLHP